MDAHWMPYTGNRNFKANPRMMVSAKGAYYTDANGRKIFDGLSGLWCLRPGPRPSPRSPRRSASQIGHAWTTRRRSSSATRCRSSWPTSITELMPAGSGPRVVHRLGLRVCRHRAEDGPRLLARQRPGQQDPPDRPREGLPRRQLRRHLGGRHRRQPQACLARAWKPTTCPHTQLASNVFSKGMPPKACRTGRRIAAPDRAARRQPTSPP